MSTLATGQIDALHTEAWLYRADHLSSKVFHIRYGVLNGLAMEIYKGDHMVLETAFPLTEAKLSSVHSEECDIKPPGINMLKGYFDGSIESQMLHTFKIKVSRSQSIIHNKLVLGFDTHEDAQFWHSKISATIRDHTPDARSTSPERTPSRQIPTDDSGQIRAEPSRGTSAEASRRGPRQQAAPRPPPRASPLPRTAPLNPSRAWEPQFNTNGLAGYREPAEGTYATCCCVGASPTQVFQHLVLLADGSSAWSFFENVKVLSPPQTEGGDMVFHARLGTRSVWMSWLGWCLGLAARDAVLRQSWALREYDGVLSLSFDSVEHAAAPPVERRTWMDVVTHWFSPVRAKIHRLAFTIAPLAQHLWDSDGRAPEDAPESMVTMLVRADLGGLLAPAAAVPGAGMLWLAPLVKSIIQIRDVLQQKRFVEPLFRVFGDPAAGGAAAYSAVRAGSMRRLASSLRLPGAAAAAAAAAADAPASAAPAGDSTAADALPGPPADEEPVGWLPEKFYYSPAGHEFKVRGANYLNDKRKQPSAEPAFRLRAMEALTTAEPLLHISPFLPVVAHSRAPFLLPVHFTLPYGGRPMHLVVVFEADADPTAEDGAADLADGDGPFARALAEYLTGTSPADDRRRNGTLKLIPMVKNGGWVMRQAVGTTPVIIGNKLQTTYHRGAHYLEVTIDIGSNSTAAGITNYVAGSVASLAIWLGFVLEGKRGEHLPERLLGTVCLDHLDLKAAKYLDVSKPLPARSTAHSRAASGAGGAATAAAPTASRAEPGVSASSAGPTGGSRRRGAAAPPPQIDAQRPSTSASSSTGSGHTSTSYEMVEPPLRRRPPR